MGGQVVLREHVGGRTYSLSVIKLRKIGRCERQKINNIFLIDVSRILFIFYFYFFVKVTKQARRAAISAGKP